MKLTSTHFGIFVIFAAVYTAGTLGLGRFSIGDLQLKPGEIGSPLVALFGWPAIAGLVAGQFVANTASPFGPIDLISPFISLLGLLAIRYLSRYTVFAGSAVYVVITSVWLSFMLSLIRPSTNTLLQAFLSQGTAIVFGIILYHILRRLEPFRPREREIIPAKQEA
ncbi:MAG: QueT transporter family protein [Nitrososphaerota archaeon]